MAAVSRLFIIFFQLLFSSCFFPSSSSLAAFSNISKPFPAIFIFGDSLVDVGNNNYIVSFARSNYLPYGIDFPQGPTGRFCNGKIIPDFLCKLLPCGGLSACNPCYLGTILSANYVYDDCWDSIGERISLPFPPPYLAPTTRGNALLQGVNYASAAGGILRNSGYDAVGRVDFDTQIQWFSNNIQELQQLLGISAAKTLIAQSVYSTTFGANDYLNNYLLRDSPASQQYTPSQYQQVVLDKFSSQVTRLYNLGVRTLAITSIGAIGCIPNLLARSINGECLDLANDLALNFNQGLNALIERLNLQLPGAQFIVLDSFAPIFEYRRNPQKYGFKVAGEACCGGGRLKGQIICLPTFQPCPNRQDYLFWDPYHPTQASNQLLANTFYQILIKRLA